MVDDLCMGFGINLTCALADLLWPPRCVACDELLPVAGDDVSIRAFCPLCAGAALAVESPLCPHCGLPFDGAGDDHLCGSCLRDTPPFRRARAAYHYGGSIATALTRFKYGSRTTSATSLGMMTAVAARLLPPIDFVVAVPLHRRQMRRRGFNQSGLLAAHVARDLAVPFIPSAVRRTRDTPSQAGLDRARRLDNIKGAFQARPDNCHEARILLIDDVITTGATVGEVAAAMLGAVKASIEKGMVGRAEAMYLRLGRYHPSPAGKLVDHRLPGAHVVRIVSTGKFRNP